MLTASNVISRQLRRAFILSAALAIIVLLGQTVFQIGSANQRIKKMIVNHSVALAQAASLSQDLLLIQREVSRFVEDLNLTQDYQVQVEVHIDDRLIASGGRVERSFLESKVDKNTTLSSGNLLTIEARIDHSSRIYSSITNALFFLFLGLIGFLILHRISRSSVRTLIEPLTELTQWIDSTAKGLPETLSSASPQLSNSIYEFEMVTESVQTLLKEIKKLQENLTEMHSAQIKAEIAAQVSHDIRSPLASLLAIAHNNPGLDENTRIQLRNTANRIRDIANQVLKKDLPAFEHQNITLSSEKMTTELLSASIESILSQKRLQFADHPEIFIEANLDGTYGLFCSIQTTEFSRILSNLINNSVEAFEKSGKVTIALKEEQNRVVITILDNGKGIPEAVLKKLGNRGETFGKAGGTGLGVFHAKTTISSWGGDLTIESEVNRGTQVRISLPQAEPPSWFVESILVNGPKTIVVLDDDESIHQIWKMRFEKTVQEKGKIVFLNFYTSTDILKWFRTTLGTVENPLYLFDYDLIGSKETGLDVIDMLGIASQSILVTSRYDDPRIQEKCVRTGVQLLPKTLALFIPIR